MRRIIGIIFSVIFVALSLPACTAQQTDTGAVLTLEQLLADTQKYNGRVVTVQAFFFQGWETIVLSERLEPSGYAQGHLVPKGKMLWVEGGIPKDIYDKLLTQSMMGPTERYGKVKVKGKFEFGGKYGHLGGFDSQITPLEVELLTWSPLDSN